MSSYPVHLSPYDFFPSLKIRADKLRDGDIYLFGDCCAYLEPAGYPRYACLLLPISEAQEHIAKIPCENSGSVQATVIIEIGGWDVYYAKSQSEIAQIDESAEKLITEIRARFPRSKVILVPPSFIVSLAAKHGRDQGAELGWHLNPFGYMELHRFLDCRIKETGQTHKETNM
jgi:hypothetical protein